MSQNKSIFVTRNLPLVPIGIFCCALLVRLIFLAESLNIPFFNYRGIDARAYHQMAVGFTEGSWPGQQVFSWPPLYPLFLGLLYRIVGQNITVLRMIHSVMGSLSCVLVYFIARSIFSGWFVPVVAAVICCLCGTMVYFDSQLLSGSLDVFLELLILLSLFYAAKHKNISCWILAGLFVGLSAINRGAILLFVPIILFWMFMVSRHRWGLDGSSVGPVFWKPAIALLLPVGLIVFPVVLHNIRYDKAGVDKKPESVGLRQFVSAGFLPVASNLGINFYLGNHWELRKVNNVDHPEFFALYKNIENEPAEKGIESPLAQSRYLVRQTFGHILEKPRDFIKLMGLKIFQLLNGAEIPRNANLYAFRQYSIVLSALLWKKIIAFPSGLIIPLGLVGIYLSRNLWRRHFLLLGCLVVQCIFILAFFVAARYRLPAIPLLAVYCAFAIESFIGCFREGEKKRAVVPFVLLLLLVLLCNSFAGEMVPNHGYSEHINLGNTLLSDGRIDDAILYYNEALKLAPHRSEAHINLANALVKKGEIDQAVVHYKKALQYQPDSFEAHYNLAAALVMQKKNAEAIEHYAASLKLKPDQTEVHYNLANILMEEDRLSEAVTYYNEALKIRPNYLQARSNLAKALAKQGNLLEAIQHWQQLVQLNPDQWVLHSNLGTAYHRLGELDKAVFHWQQTLRLKPDHVRIINQLAWLLATSQNPKYRDSARAVELAERGCNLTAYSEPTLLDTLAAAYAQAGRFDEAVRTAERALGLAKLVRQEKLTAGINSRLEMYKQGQPYYEP